MANNYQSNNGQNRPAAQLATPEQLKALEQLTSPEVAKFAGLLRMMLPNAAQLTDAQIIAAAVYGKETGLDPISGQFYVTKEQGVMRGYKGAVDLIARKSRPNWYHRPMTAEERELHGLGPKDWGSICVLTDIDTAVQMRDLGLSYHPTEGVGIVRYDDILVKERWEGDYPNRRKVTLPKDQWQPAPAPVGRSWQWRAEIRSFKDACNRTPGLDWMVEELNESAEGILEAGAADIPGFNWPPDAAKLSKEQAHAWVEKERHSARLRTDPQFAAERMEQVRNIGERNTLQRQYDDWKLSMTPCPHCNAPDETPYGRHAAGCPFRALGPAAEPPAQPAPVDAEEGDFRPADADEPPSAADDFDAIPGAADELGINAARADDALLAQVRDRLQTAARDGDPAPPDDRTLRHVRGSMANLFGRDDETRKAVLKWAFGANSSSDLTVGMCRGMIDFIGSTKAGDEWIPSDTAINFLRTFRRAVMGQQELL